MCSEGNAFSETLRERMLNRCNRRSTMSIIFNEQTKTFTLHTRHTTYQMKIGNLDYLLHLYYGPTMHDADLSYQIMQYDRGFSGNPYESRDARTFSLDAQPQEFSTQQQGDFRTTSIEVVNANVIPLMEKSRASRYGKKNISWTPCPVPMQKRASRWTRWRSYFPTISAT